MLSQGYGAAAAATGGYDANSWAAAQAQIQWASAAQAQGLTADSGMWQGSNALAVQQQQQALQQQQDRLGPKGAGKHSGKDDDLPTARFLLVNLDPSITEEEIRNYFGTFAEIEEVTMRTLTSGQIMGSVKFSEPTAILRKIMLDEVHKIRGLDVTVQTWKMQKLKKPGYIAKITAMRSAKGKGKGKGKLPGAGPYGGAGALGWEAQAAWEAQGDEEALAQEEQSMWAQASAVPTAEVGFAEQVMEGGAGGVWASFDASGAENGAGAGAIVPAEGAGGPRREKDADVAARFMLIGLTAAVTEEGIREYFSQYGEIEEVTLRPGAARINGSVKFAEPTVELRRAMVSKVHSICGAHITVETWKMQKLRRPGFQAMQAGKGGSKCGGCDGGKGGWGCGGGAWDGWSAQSSWAGKGGPSWASSGYGQGMSPYGKGAYVGCGGAGYGAGAAGLYGGGGGGGCYGGCYGGGGGGCYGGDYGGAAAGGGSGSDYGAAAGGYGCGAGGGAEGDITSRYLLLDLPTDTTELELQEYFSAFAVIEEVTLKTLNSGKVMGSVKFANPTADLRNIMFREVHHLKGKRISVQTWKMQKLQKPGFAAKLAEQRAAYKARGGNARFHPYGAHQQQHQQQQQQQLTFHGELSGHLA